MEAQAEAAIPCPCVCYGTAFQCGAVCAYASMEDTAVEEPEVSGAAEFAPALVAAHPHGNSVAVAIGPELRAFDLRFRN